VFQTEIRVVADGAQRLPVIQPEVVVVPAKDFSTLNTAMVDELDVLQPFGLTNLIC